MIDRWLACRSDELLEGASLRLDVRFSGEATSLILARFDGRCVSYLNRCTHMGRPLDGEDDRIFDPSGTYLRCSMHGSLFDPLTGAALSPLCKGQPLTSVRIQEEDGAIWIKDRRVSQPPG